MSTKNKHFPKHCPSCQSTLAVTRLQCDHCETEIGGHYPLPALARLSTEDQAFILQFVETSGSLKEMAKRLSISYPTVRNRLNEIIETLQTETDSPKETND